MFHVEHLQQSNSPVENTARNLDDSTMQIKHSHIWHCYQADPDYGKSVADALKICLDAVDLDLPDAVSKEKWHAANNARPEYNQPTKPVGSGLSIDINEETGYI